MFFAPDMLSKRGPLAKVWLAAHVEKKVSKTQTLQTSIPSTVEVILDPSSSSSQQAPPLALRLSGQLLLGITRIYGKQAKYLLEDCSEASDKIRAAFRAALASDLSGPNRLGIKMVPAELGTGDAQQAINLRPANRDIFDFELEFGGEFDGFGDGWNAEHFLDPENTRAGARITASLADITLIEEGDGFGDMGDQMDIDLDLDFGGGGAQDVFGEDAGLDLGLVDADASSRRRGTKRQATDNEDEGLGDQTLEMELGRDAPGSVDRRSARESLGPDVHMSAKSDDHPASGGIGEISMDIDPGFESTRFDRADDDFRGQDLDLGLDLGLGGAGAAEPGDRTPQASRSREQTPTLDSQAADQNPLLGSIEVTPRTSHRLAQLQSPVRPAAAGADGQPGTAVKKPPTKKQRTQLVDVVTELEGNGAPGRAAGLGSQGGSQSVGGMGASSRAEKIASGLYVEPQYLPKNRYELACLEIRLNPRRNKCLPTRIEYEGSQWLLAAPPGVCAELTNLFKFPAPNDTQSTRAGKQRAVDEVDVQRIDQRGRSVESEMGRRQDEERLVAETSGVEDVLGNDTFDGRADETGVMTELGEGGPVMEDDFRFEMQSNPDLHLGGDEDVPPVRSPSRALSEIPGPTPRVRAEGESSVLDLFDELAESQATQSSVREGAIQDSGRGPVGGTKWSKNTMKALRVLKDQLGLDEGEGEGEGEAERSMGRKKIKFEKVSEKASKRAASSFFFELLVLATRDCIKLDQPAAYGPITVEDQDRLWEVVEQEGV
ncbi:hypothetical protein CROQUDRAFT_651549 [Cronartium quercuum f. sp. fusiforme G11]|uniref:Double-strand-break repair protein rad21 n=1 Tax=Cronartium quercuum f. sp. fusiforme G11 TaxID=708437 RepID=A0A9P6NRS2_9BASI|nr:hypothetical protein CROQUDRAFT_651549 [Cronartium quercuum f. sp. fusiforme G11]